MPDDEKKDEAQMEDGGGELNVDAIVKAIEDGTIMVKDFDAIRAAMDTAGGSGEAEEAVAEPPPENEAPVEFQEDEDLPAQEMKADEPKASFDAATEARIAGLEDRLSTIETENAVKARFAAGVETLEGKGFALSDSTKEKLLKAAGEGDKVFKLFTDTYEESALRDPPDTLTGQPADENYPEAVMAYFGHGPEETAAAIQMFREWSELPDDRHRSPLDKYLARNMKRREAV